MTVSEKPAKKVMKNVKAKALPKEVSKPKAKKSDPALTSLVNSLNKRFGENSVTLGVPSYLKGAIPRIPTGSIALDVALGGGIPVGRQTNISGHFSSTKTSQLMHIIREAQQMGLKCAHVDAEGTSDRKYMESFGIDVDDLIYMQPDSLEEATDFLLELQRSKVVHFAGLDSIASLTTNKDMDTKMEDVVQMGGPQKGWDRYFKKYQMNNNRLTREGNTPFTIVFLNQVREKIGSYGDPEYTPGGRAKDFTSSVDIRLRKGDWIKEGKGQNAETVGQVVKFRIDKNKTFLRNQTGEFDFYNSEKNVANIPRFYNDNPKSLLISAIEWGVVERGGAWFYYEDGKWNGAEAFVSAFRNDAESIAKIKGEILSAMAKELQHEEN